MSRHLDAEIGLFSYIFYRVQWFKRILASIIATEYISWLIIECTELIYGKFLLPKMILFVVTRVILSKSFNIHNKWYTESEM